MNCFICGKEMQLLKKSNYSKSNVSEFSFASRKIPEYMHWDLYECKNCMVLVSGNAPDFSALKDEYANAAFDSKNEADKASQTYMAYLKKFLPDFPRSKVMDIGTGEGSFLKYLLAEGAGMDNYGGGVIGIEPSVSPIMAADESVKGLIRNEMFDASRFEKESFDMISCFQTIEHIPDSCNLLEGIYKLLKIGGYAYFVCHSYTSLVNRVLGFHSPIYDIEHLQIFSKKSIRKIFEKIGFSDIKTFDLKNKYPLSYWLKLFPLSIEKKKKFMEAMQKNKLLSKIEMSINVGNVGIIAKK